MKQSVERGEMMKRIVYEKIVRDGIPEIIARGGKKAIVRKLDAREAVEKLEDKLTEELQEYLQDHSLEELADLLEVIHGLVLHRGIEWQELEEIRLRKRAERGGFEAGIYLEAVVEED